eukprot:CAMPEP_0181096934 /NCGR_PEP_ID=MMETSP1071-20121207/11294_1 /TAXON_ID=35127 /ORGANISM="Thalassiosira sp., Strain NH16" /LENGTH=222 /DNA_ID=CAMNT_0023179369 /DNA_START=328 /DNA_END=996 /DNA_ORIENTATION=-
MEGNNALPLDEEATVARLGNTKAHTIVNGRLYLGPAQAASNEGAVMADGIAHILNITREVPKEQYSGVTVCHLSCWDSPEQRLPFEEAAEFIDRCLNDEAINDEATASSSVRRRCLVHCNAGQSRSASIILYYLMTKGHTLKQSYNYVKSRKPDIRPNFGFFSQLQEAEMKLFGSVSLDMDEYKADTICDILEGSNKTREDVLKALRWAKGDGEVALGMLLE